jgi:O-acetyl-ADP-ribose deacetylase (regulator of RNase III)
MNITLVALDPALARAWRNAFDSVDRVRVVEGNYFDHIADAMVSPANSFGIMDGGIDLAIREALGLSVQRKLQEQIVANHHGELPVGCAEIVATDHAKWPWLVAVPTMRVPESVANTLNAYLAFRAALLACAKHGSIKSMVCCGLATGIGRMEPTRCAAQMRIAYKHALDPARIPSFQAIHAVHTALRTS